MMNHIPSCVNAEAPRWGKTLFTLFDKKPGNLFKVVRICQRVIKNLVEDIPTFYKITCKVHVPPFLLNSIVNSYHWEKKKQSMLY